MLNQSGWLRGLFFFLLLSLSVADLWGQENIKLLAIRVEFQEDDDILTTGNGTFDLASVPPESLTVIIDPPPHNKGYFGSHLQYLRGYYKKVSDGEIDIRYDVFPAEEDSAYRLPQKMAYYNPNTTQDEIYGGIARLFYDAWSIAAQDTSLDLNDYDCFFVFHAGVGKDVAMVFDETSKDIPSLYLTEEFLQKYLPPELPPVPVTQGAVLPETETQDGYELALNGMVVANFATYLGMADLFNGETGRSAVGIFDLMDAGLFNGQGLLPSIPMAWHRLKMGWDEAVTVTSAADSQMIIGSYKSGGRNKIYKFPVTTSEYFLMELRNPDANIDSLRYADATEESYPNVKEILLRYYSDRVEFSPEGVLVGVNNLDMGMPGSGLLIWHVDENVINMRTEAGESINGDKEHRGIDLEEADGSQDIGEEFDFLSAGSGTEVGWRGDMFFAGNNAPVYLQNGNSFSPYTIPSSRSYYLNGNSHLQLSGFSAPDSLMSFTVDYSLFAEGFPVHLPFYGKTVAVFDAAGIEDDDNRYLLFGTETEGYLVSFPSNTIIDSVELTGGALQRILRSSVRPSTFLWQTERAVILTDYQGGTLQKRVLDSLSADDSFSALTVFPDVEGDYLFYGREKGGGALWFISADSEEKMTTFPQGMYDYFYPFIADARLQCITGDAYAPIVFDPITEEQTAILTADNSNGPTVDGWIIKNDEGTYDFYFMKENASLFKYETASGDLSVIGGFDFSLLSAEEAFVTPDVLLFPTQWDIYGKAVPVFAVRSSDIVLLNFNGAMVLNFPQSVLNYKLSGSAQTFLPLMNSGPSFSADNTYLPVLFSVNGQTEENDPQIGGTVLSMFNAKGELNDEYLLPMGSAITDIRVLSGTDGYVLAVTDSSNMFALFTLPGEPLLTDAYYNLLNYNLKYFTYDIFETGEVLSLSNELLPKKTVYNWPNPVKGNSTRIRFYVSEDAKVKINIYNQAGFTVWEKQISAVGGMDNDVEWDVTAVSSGVYLASITAESQSRKESKIIKIAVVK